MLLPPSLLLASIACIASAAALGISGKVSVTSQDGDRVFKLPHAPIDLDLASTYKLSFTHDGQALAQSSILFDSAEDHVVLPVTIKGSRGTFTINTKTALSGTYNLTLLLSNLEDKLAQPVGQITLDRPTRPVVVDGPAFSVLPELFHTFSQGEKAVNPVIAAAGTAFVLAPWLILTRIRLPKTSTPPFAFLLSLTALEGLIFTYWIGLKLYQLLPAFILLGLLAAYTGKRALQ